VSVIAGFAKGLLSLLDSQNFGQAPKVLIDNVSPIVDLSPLYLLQKQGGFFGSNSAPANGFNLLTAPAAIVSSVPSGEVWRLHALSIIIAAGAGASINAAPAIRIDGNAIPLAPLQVVAATQTLVSMSLAPPLWLNAGTELGFYAQATVLAPVVAWQAVVSRLKA